MVNGVIKRPFGQDVGGDYRGLLNRHGRTTVKAIGLTDKQRKFLSLYLSNGCDHIAASMVMHPDDSHMDQVSKAGAYLNNRRVQAAITEMVSSKLRGVLSVSTDIMMKQLAGYKKLQDEAEHGLLPLKASADVRNLLTSLSKHLVKSANSPVTTEHSSINDLSIQELEEILQRLKDGKEENAAVSAVDVTPHASIDDDLDNPEDDLEPDPDGDE